MTHPKPQQPKGTVLLIDHSLSCNPQLISCLSDAYHLHFEAREAGGLVYWREYQPEVVICSVNDSQSHGLDLLKEITAESAETQVIMTSAADDMAIVVSALRLGAADFLIKPITDTEVLLHAVNRAFEEHQLLLQNRLYREALEKTNRELAESLRVLKEDQEAGRAVQLKMLPAPSKTYNNVEIQYAILPSLYLSGDCVDYFSLGSHRLGFYLADVSGHGASSAFVTVLLKTIANRVRQSYMRSERQQSFPEILLTSANEELIPLGLGKHLAVFCGLIDLLDNKLIYCSAAHFPPPILITDDRVIPLEGRGLPIGLFEDVSLDIHEVNLGETFRLVVFSDGVLELMPQQSVTEKEQSLLEIVSSGIHNVSQLMEKLNLRDKMAVPDDVALMTICSTGLRVR